MNQFAQIKPPTPKPAPTSGPASALVGETKDGIYIPANAINSTPNHEIIALIGAPGSGKTTAALTFPNLFAADFDHKLPEGILSVPFWNPAFCDTLAKRTFGVVNRRDAFKKWLRENHDKFTDKQTFFLDSWTLMMNAFDIQTYAEEPAMGSTKSGDVNKFWFWSQKAKYAKEIIEYLKAMACRVVVSFHECPDRDEDGELNGKLRPVMDGGFKDQLLGNFTDTWRQVANIYEKDANNRPILKDGKKVIKSVSHNGNPNWVWFWQLKGDALIDTNCNPNLGRAVLKHNITYVPADYNEIVKLYNS